MALPSPVIYPFFRQDVTSFGVGSYHSLISSVTPFLPLVPYDGSSSDSPSFCFRSLFGVDGRPPDRISPTRPRFVNSYSGPLTAALLPPSYYGDEQFPFSFLGNAARPSDLSRAYFVGWSRVANLARVIRQSASPPFPPE